MTQVITLEHFIAVYSIVYRYCFEQQTGISHITTVGRQNKITRDYKCCKSCTFDGSLNCFYK